MSVLLTDRQFPRRFPLGSRLRDIRHFTMESLILAQDER